MPLPDTVRDLLGATSTLPFGTDSNGRPVEITITAVAADAQESIQNSIKAVSGKAPESLDDETISEETVEWMNRSLGLMRDALRLVITHVHIVEEEGQSAVAHEVAPLSEDETSFLCSRAGYEVVTEAYLSTLRLYGFPVGPQEGSDPLAVGETAN